MASFEHLERLLTRAGRLLDEAASEIRDLRLNSSKNIRKIGEALANVAEIRLEIYKRRPDLCPEHLKKKNARENGSDQDPDRP